MEGDGAKIIREIFEPYASDETVAEIIRNLNRRKLTTLLGISFNKSRVHRILNNKRYIGIYIYKGQETPNDVARIIEAGLFEQVHRMFRSQQKTFHFRDREKYLYNNKIFCGYWREMMRDYDGIVKSRKTACNNFKRRKLLTTSNIEKIAIKVSGAYKEDNAIENF